MKNSPYLVTTYLAVILVALLFALPNVLPASVLERWPDALPNKPVALGLDLRGGSHLVLEVDGSELRRERSRTLADEARRMLREADTPWRGVETSERGVVVLLRSAAQQQRALDVLAALSNPVGAARKDLDITPRGEDGIELVFTAEGQHQSITRAVEQSLEVIRQRVDQVGVSEPTIQRVGADRILVQLPGLQDPAQLRALLGSTAKMSFHMLGDSSSPDGIRTLQDSEGNSYPVRNSVALSGDRLSDASAGFDQQTREPVVNFRFDRAGAREFAAITEANVGRPFAIVLDGKVLSAPVIREPITGGSGQISGNFSVQEAGTLSALLRAGALPAKLTVIEERSVGADLGSDVIQKGIYAGIGAFVLVFLFMFVLYGGWGLVANVALALNVVLTIAGMSMLGATLTLPGIAGIVLGIGLAVDANVLINERIREETLKGKAAVTAIDAGFRRAYATVMDSNVTALIATVLLFWFGSGPVRGFAITMALGIVISMFTAVSVVKVMMLSIARRRRLKTIEIRPLFGFRPVPDGTRFDFMKARFAGLGVAAVLVAASLFLLFKPGLNFGIDFRGGIQMEVSAGIPDDLSRYRTQLDGLGLGEVSLQTVGSEDRLLVRVERQPGGEAQQTAAVERLKAAVLEIDPSASFERTEVVGPKVSGELAQAGVIAVILASLAMLVYIWVRFEWPFAVGAILTLVLDVVLTLGVFAITGLDFSLTAIAALLTLVGYSVNDKVVVYDRMRENLRSLRKQPLREVIDMSINQTLTRSLYTSVTAFLAVLPLAVWGGSAVASFAVPMAAGIIIAACSSVFIAAPILLFLGDWRSRRGRSMFAPDTEADGPLPVPAGAPGSPGGVA
ncbi:MAG: protein translocase subunit SecD [Acidovorax sp.]|uniref:protein translocase subunit SecD n=1 Tax=Acidovorax sp. TaxID=1872122 RepID=UPI0026130D89|nr:protein translocase subunit SecD [Acidovorax sp.]MDH4465065.1 protein translocase subunit SecD [Acidovorax sp.]